MHPVLHFWKSGRLLSSFFFIVRTSFTFADILSANQGSELCSQADSVADAGRKKIEEIYGKYDQLCEAVRLARSLFDFLKEH